MRKFIFAALGVTMISAAAQASFVYAVDIRNDRFVRFDTMSPGSQTVLATGVTANYFGMDFNSTASTLYAAASPAAGTAQLHTLNLANGAVTSNIGITGIDSDANVTGLTIGASNQAFLSANGTSGGNKLYSLNLMTGAASFIGNMGVGGTNLIIDIAINSAGQMVAHDIATDSFSFVNTSTGALTPIGPHGLAANFAQGMDFDHSNNT
ncbi:MAG TPA: hypothetical protein VEX38_08230, partial [Fimbriimonadaceae bacterium]|nr:hypothetical protein [Fimbriimonadaceae bacterium]